MEEFSLKRVEGREEIANALINAGVSPEETEYLKPGSKTTEKSDGQNVDALQALVEAGYSIEDIQQLLANLPEDISHEELQQAVNNILARGESLAPDNPVLEHVTRASDVEFKPPQWVIEPFIQIGSLTLIQGEPGVGKTAAACGLAAHVSTGNPISTADGTQKILIQNSGNILMLSVEDDLALLKGRFENSGGDATKLCFLDDAYSLSLANSSDLERLEKVIKEVNARLVIFDPLQAFLGEKVDMHRANQTRPILARLVEIAKRCVCGIVIIAHTSKGSKENSPVMRSLGSVDIPAACRSILQVEKTDPEYNEISIFHIKSNSAPKGKTIIYTIGNYGGVCWERFTDETLLHFEQSTGRGTPEKDECTNFILQVLSDGNIQSKELDELCDNAGFSRSTRDRAKTDLRRKDKIRYEFKTENGKRTTYTALVSASA